MGGSIVGQATPPPTPLTTVKGGDVPELLTDVGAAAALARDAEAGERSTEHLAREATEAVTLRTEQHRRLR